MVHALPLAIECPWAAKHIRAGCDGARRNGCHGPNVSRNVTLRASLAAVCTATCLLAAVAGDYASAERKFSLIEHESLRAGARVTLTPGELTAVAAHELPAGVRNPHLEVVSAGIATGTALVDFGRVRRAQGY